MTLVLLSPVMGAQTKKPNIVVIMGDDIGIWNIGAYQRGMMAGRTPNLDKLHRLHLSLPAHKIGFHGAEQHST